MTPSPADKARATSFIDNDFSRTVDPEWLARHRDALIHQTATWAMIERQDVESIAGDSVHIGEVA